MWSHVDWLQTPRKAGSKVEDEDMSDLSCRTRERVSGTTGGGGEASAETAANLAAVTVKGEQAVEGLR